MTTFKSDAVKSGLMFLGTAQPGCILCRSGRVKEKFTAADVAELVPIPKGAMVLDVRVVNEALDACTSVSVGDKADPDRYFAALDLSSAGAHSALSEGPTTAHNHVYADEAVLTVTVPATQTTAKAITVHVLYKMVEGCLTDEADVFPAA
jgi:hypothetical protein